MNAGIAVKVPVRYLIWYHPLALIQRRKVGIDRDDMNKEHKNIIEQIAIGLVSTLFVAGLLYYALFYSFIHDWIVKLWKMILLILN